MDAVRIREQLSQGPGAELFWAHPSVWCSEDKGCWSLGLRVGTSASYQIGEYVPYPVWIKGWRLLPFLPSAQFLPLPVVSVVFMGTVLQNRCDGPDQFHQHIRNKHFPLHLCRACVFSFILSLSFKCFYYEPSDESFFFLLRLFSELGTFHRVSQGNKSLGASKLKSFLQLRIRASG